MQMQRISCRLFLKETRRHSPRAQSVTFVRHEVKQVSNAQVQLLIALFFPGSALGTTLNTTCLYAPGNRQVIS